MTITVYGTPAPQGSKRFLGIRGGKGILVESSKAVKPWRDSVGWAVVEACRDHGGALYIADPVRVTMVFTLPRPKSAKRGALPSKKPDLSKLVRATEDALTDAGIWEDDARVVSLFAEKRYPDQGPGLSAPPTHSLDRPGAVIVIEPA